MRLLLAMILMMSFNAFAQRQNTEQKGEQQQNYEPIEDNGLMVVCNEPKRVNSSRTVEERITVKTDLYYFGTTLCIRGASTSIETNSCYMGNCNTFYQGPIHVVREQCFDSGRSLAEALAYQLCSSIDSASFKLGFGQWEAVELQVSPEQE